VATLQASDLADLTTTTLNELGELKFTDLMSDYQFTIALKRIFNKKKTTFDAGPAVNFNVITDHNNSARFVGLGEVDVVDIPNVMTTGTVPWRHITWNWAIERREVAMNRTPRKIVDLIKTRRVASFGSAIIKFEQSLWRCPATTDNVSPYGVPYWVVKSNTAATSANNDGFNGTVPSGYTSVGGLNPTTYRRWSNYATQYTSVTKEDFIRKGRRMLTYTDFMPLVDDIPVYNTGDEMGLYSNYGLISGLEEILEAQNDDLGTDVASMDGKVLFRRSPLTFVKELDLDTTNPMYALNWGEFKTMGLRGEWMHETTEPIYPGQHTLSATFTDCTFNMICRNRRRNGVIATDVTMPA
jgi:hypothetical protein